MLPIGIQLYSLRDLAQKDFPEVLKQVAEMGYKLVEPQVFSTFVRANSRRCSTISVWEWFRRIRRGAVPEM